MIEALLSLVRFKGHCRTASSFDVLKRKVSAEIWRRVERNTPDWRHRMANLALELNTAEGELISKAARELRIRAVSMIEPMAAGIVRRFGNLARLRESGAILTAEKGVVKRVICVDPARARDVIMKYNPVEICLSSWLLIAHALEASEQILRDENSRVDLITKKVLAVIAGEIASYGGASGKISLGDLLRYEFIGADGQIRRGTIDERLRYGLNAIGEQCMSGTSIELPESKGSVAWRPGDALSELVLMLPKQRAEAAESIQPFAPAANVVQFPGVPAAPAMRQGLVVIVDDNLIFCRVLERFFERAGLTVAQFSDGQEALRRFESREIHPDLIVSDVHMPALNGLEFLRRVRAFLTTPFIMLSSDNDVETKLELLKNGADAYLSKADDPRILCLQAQKLIERRQAA